MSYPGHRHEPPRYAPPPNEAAPHHQAAQYPAAPYEPAPQYPPPAPHPPAPAPLRTTRHNGFVAALGVGVVVLSLGAVAVLVAATRDRVSPTPAPAAPATPRVAAGACLAGDEVDSGNDRFQKTQVRAVPCTSANARYEIVGRVDGLTQDEATDAVCRRFAGAELIYWEGRTGEPGFVLCLKPR